MNIRNRKELRTFAAQRLENAPNAGKILLIFIALSTGLSILSTGVNYLLGLAISNSGGLGSMGRRTVLSSLQTLLPLAVSMLNLCLEVGLLSTMLRTARGQYASPQGLRMGLDRFWVMLRCKVLKGLIYVCVTFFCLYVGVILFMITPLSQPVVALLTPYMEEMSLLSPELTVPAEVFDQLFLTILPAYAICGLLLAVLGGPMMYAYRLTTYLLIDNPAMGAMAAIRQSKSLMRGHKRSLLLLDLSLWPYYLALLASSVICYGDMLLPLVGIPLPGHPDIWFFAFMALYLLLNGVICYFLRAKVEVTYALAYDAIKPEEKKDNGVVLGNIFQM